MTTMPRDILNCTAPFHSAKHLNWIGLSHETLSSADQCKHTGHLTQFPWKPTKCTQKHSNRNCERSAWLLDIPSVPRNNFS